MKKLKWELIERRWYCSSLGGICKENTGKWHCYILTDREEDNIPSDISFGTLKKAKKWFEKLGDNL